MNGGTIGCVCTVFLGSIKLGNCYILMIGAIHCTELYRLYGLNLVLSVIGVIVLYFGINKNGQLLHSHDGNNPVILI